MLFIDDDQIFRELGQPLNLDPLHIRDILNKAKALAGLNFHEVLTLLAIESPESLEELFAMAAWVKNEIYGRRMVLFTPMYLTNKCQNECLYCAFRQSNKDLVRTTLAMEQLRQETEIIVGQGQKRVLLVAGEDDSASHLEDVFHAIDVIYSVKKPYGSIRRINVNIAPLSVESFRQLKQKDVGTYQLFQETYHRPTYQKMHLAGPKKDYDYRLTGMDRALSAGLDDIGVGVLFGLYDWKYEVLALLQHVRHLEHQFGIGPHTISVPRIEPAFRSEVSCRPPHPVLDQDFKKIVAVLRLAVPYTGIILSTREKASLRKELFNLGISQISAASKTNPGGHMNSKNDPLAQEQFSLGDTRSLAEVVSDLLERGFVPSFCTACYRKGRVGADFMDLAKPGLIKEHCLPNGLFSFAEYLHDFADPRLKAKGLAFIEDMLATEMSSESAQKLVARLLGEISSGQRDICF